MLSNFRFVSSCIPAALSAYFSGLKSFQVACNEANYQINRKLVSITHAMGLRDRRNGTLHVHKDLMFGVNWCQHCMKKRQKVYFR